MYLDIEKIYDRKILYECAVSFYDNKIFHFYLIILYLSVCINNTLIFICKCDNHKDFLKGSTNIVVIVSSFFLRGKNNLLILCLIMIFVSSLFFRII